LTTARARCPRFHVVSTSSARLGRYPAAMIFNRLLASTALSALAFAAAGALSRYELRSTETRYQVAAFVVAAVAVELIVAASRLARPSWRRFLANAVAAALVIVLVKFQLEPVARAQDAAAVRHAARALARDVRRVR
jgi:hypothetical protein